MEGLSSVGEGNGLPLFVRSLSMQGRFGPATDSG